MQIHFKATLPACPAVALAVPENGVWSGGISSVDDRTGGALSRAAAASRFTGAAGQTLAIPNAPGLEGATAILVGCGAVDQLVPLQVEKTGGVMAAALERAGFQTAAIIAALPPEAGIPAAEGAALLAGGAGLRCYRYDRLRTVSRPDDAASLADLTIVVPGAPAAEAAFMPMAASMAGVALARDLTNAPSNLITPESFVDEVKSVVEPLGVRVEVLEVDDLIREGFGGLLAVGAGATVPPRLLLLHWSGAESSAEQPVALIGKGITFDTGGISLKPRQGMWDMKGDMAGGAAVAGAIAALAGRQAGINVIAAVPLAINALGGAAYRPGDVLRLHGGSTVEIIDTDAEGRLVLCDALHYVATRFQPRAMVDVATLTGSIIRALGGGFAGLFATDDPLAESLVSAGQATGDRLWRMPLDAFYDANLESDIADLRQVAPDEASADAVHGATLLKHFVDDIPWAHIDTAKLDQADKDEPLGRKGATGFGVRLLDRWAASFAET